jgi:hypothetical protein
MMSKQWRVNNYKKYNHYPGLESEVIELLVKKVSKALMAPGGD